MPFTYKIETIKKQDVYAVVTLDGRSTGIFTAEKDRAKLVSRLLEELEAKEPGVSWIVK